MPAERDASVLLGGVRRLLIMTASIGGATLAFSLVLALLAGASVRRSIAVGFYLVGSVLLLTGFFVGNRGVLRAESDLRRPSLFGFGRNRVRSATGEEQRESVRTSALVIGLGIALLILGTLADNEKSLI
jgi:NAD/NADP transhydrogenase beta subunit